MSKELDLQTKIRQSVEADGGYARKLSHRFSVGIPDLLISLPGICPCLCEVKDLGQMVDKFDVSIGITPKQTLELRRFGSVTEKSTGRTSAFILVGLIHRDEHRLVVLPRDAERLAYGYEAVPSGFQKRIRQAKGQVEKYYDIRLLMRHIQVCATL